MSRDNSFKKAWPNGKPVKCKFCHKEVWWHTIERRYYDVGGETFHVENCELRKEYHKKQAADTAEARRQTNSGGTSNAHE